MSVKTISQSLIANKILDRLNEYDNRFNYLFTEAIVLPIFSALGMKNTQTNRTQCRRIMDRLFSAGHVVRTGSANKHAYSISPKARIDGWDRNFPFTGSGQQVNTIIPEEDEVEEVEETVEPEKEESPPAAANSLEASALECHTAELESLRYRVRELETNEKLIRKDLEEKEVRMDAIEKIAASSLKTLKIEHYDGKVITLKNVILPECFQTVLDLAKARRNIMLVGPAGCGKSTIASLLAKTLGMKFGKIGGSGGVTEIHLLGRSNQNIAKGTEKYRESEFVRRYEQGGVMCIDEIDAFDQNVLLALNSALDDSGVLSLPNRLDNPIAKKSKDFIAVGTANTFGKGSDRIYAGRSQLDGSSISRFRIGMVEVGYDPNIERAVCPDDELRTEIQGFRKRMEECIIRQVIDTRFLADAYTMKTVAKWSHDTIYKALFAGWSRDERSKVMAS